MTKMKRLALVFAAVMLAAGTARADIAPSDTYVPNDLVLGGGLKELKDTFYKTQDLQQQIIIVKMITKSTDPKRFDVLMDIALWDLHGAETAGQSFNTAPEARLIALQTVGTTKDPKYAPGYLRILQFDANTDLRIQAAKNVAQITNDDMIQALINLVRHDYNYANFREDNTKQFNDDRVVEAIVKAMGDIGDPRFFPALLEVVTVRNHRNATVMAAWDAMEKLKW